MCTYSSTSFVALSFLVLSLIYPKFLISTLSIFFAWILIMINNLNLTLSHTTLLFLSPLKFLQVFKRCISQNYHWSIDTSHFCSSFFIRIAVMFHSSVLGPSYRNQLHYTLSFLPYLIEASFLFTFPSKLNMLLLTNF